MSWRGKNCRPIELARTANAVRFALLSAFCRFARAADVVPAVADACAPVADARASQPPAAIDFARDVAPIFVEHCYQCHGPDKQEVGLAARPARSGAQGGRLGTAASWPARAAKASWCGASGRPMTTSECRRRARRTSRCRRRKSTSLIAWIDAGAVWPEGAAAGSTHWSFQPIARPAPPAVKNDRLAARRDRSFRAGAAGSARASRRRPRPTATRSSSDCRYDLLGLPPTPAEVDAFVTDASPDAYERLVDRLLDSPHFGERWGRHWLDMARYADSDGYEKDNAAARRLALSRLGDRRGQRGPAARSIHDRAAGRRPVAGRDADERLATAFHRQTLTNTEGGADQEQFRVEAIFDRVATTGSVWLGLTVGCAQCHSHKYDPISHQEYYRLFAFFNNGDEVETEVPLVGRAAGQVGARQTRRRAKAGQARAQAGRDAGRSWPPSCRPGKSELQRQRRRAARVSSGRAGWA